MDDPSSWPDRFPSEQTREDERKRLHEVLKRLIPWEASGNDNTLNEARWEIARTIAWAWGEQPPLLEDKNSIRDYLRTHGPTICDPFCGAGSIPLEAQRLGLNVRASDLNPVSVLITKALVELPYKFAKQVPVNPSFRESHQSSLWQGEGAAGLAQDVKYYARRLREEAAKQLDRYYPEIDIGGTTARTVAYFWVRTVRSPDPSAKDVHVPLASSFLLSSKAGQSTWIRPTVIDAACGEYCFEVVNGVPDPDEVVRVRSGTKAPGRSSDFTCLLTGATIRGDYIKSEGMADRLGMRLMAIVVQAGRTRIYVAPTEAQEQVAAGASKEDKVNEARNNWLSQPVPARLTGGTCHPYGLTTFAKLYTDRQLLALTTFTDLLEDIRSEVLRDAIAAGLNVEPARLVSGGVGAEAYADGVITCLGLAIGRMALYGSALCRWLTKDNALGSAIPQKGARDDLGFRGSELSVGVKRVNPDMRIKYFRVSLVLGL